MAKLSKEDNKKVYDFVVDIDSSINDFVENNPTTSRIIALTLGCIICKMVVERYGKSQEAHDQLNEIMADSWNSVRIVK